MPGADRAGRPLLLNVLRKCIALVVPTITLWNTVYLERSAALLTKSRAVASPLLKHVSTRLGATLL